MTDKEKLIKIKKLADAMYYAAQYLTTDASRLHKAMDKYHKFTIHECKEEPIPWLTPDQARKAVEIAREETLLKVAAWINDTFIFSKQAKEDFSQTFNIMKELL